MQEIIACWKSHSLEEIERGCALATDQISSFQGLLKALSKEQQRENNGCLRFSELVCLFDGFEQSTQYYLALWALAHLVEDHEEFLDFSLNLRRKGLKKLPENIGNLSEIKSLNVMQNNLKELPASIVTLKNLQRLDARQNQLL